MMEGGPLLADWWVDAAKSDFIPYLNISSQLPDTPDPNMLRRMGGRGFPFFVVLDDLGQRVVPGKAFPQFRPMNKSGTDVVLRGVQELIDVRATTRSDPKSAALKANLTLLEWLLIQGKSSDAEAESATKVEGVDQELVQRYRAQVVLNQYMAAVKSLTRTDLDGRRAAFDQAALSMFKVYGEGEPIYDTGLRVFSDYWRLVFSGAILSKDLEAAEKSLAVYRRVYSNNPQMRERIDQMVRELEAARQPKE